MTTSAIKKAVALYLGDRDRHGRKIDKAKTAGDDEAVFRLTRKKAELRNLPMNLRREEF